MSNEAANIMFYMVLMIILWIMFSQLDKLKSANEKCCTNQSCGKDPLDGFFWSTFLAFGIMATLAFVYYAGMMALKARTGGRSAPVFRSMV